jgi:D-beta-D-heptose 7-phosphate kinase/D-beta-D-heptose 1-phosphate adenosyltransferase
VIREPGRKTTLKTRVVAVQGGRPTRQAALYGHHQLLRLDEESRHPISPESIHQVLSFAAEMMSEVRGVVISDYAKGALPKHLVEELIRLARAAGKPVFVDPKERDWHRYRGAAVLTPNSVEAEAALGLQFSAAEELADLAWERTIQDRLAEWSLEGLLVTRGAEGVSLIDRQGFHHFPTSARAVFDVTGAGDTVLAVFALAVGSGASFGEAAQLGNLAAGVVVGKSGAAVAHPFEIEKELDSRHHSAETKIRTPEEIGSIAEALRRDGKKIVFTNGCFDLLHVGHVYLLREARKLGDALVVGLNSDASVQRLKGEQRPLVGSEDRAYALAALESVDYLVLFEESDPMNLLRSIRPDVLVKGDDYAESDVIGADLLKSYGGVTRLIPIRQGVSTSRLIEKIRSAGQGAESP